MRRIAFYNSPAARVILSFSYPCVNGFFRAHCYTMMVQELTSQDTHIGTKFRGVRTAKGLSYAQVAEAIKVRPEYLESIENLTQDGLPEVGYVLGYVRSYAKFLGLDAGSAVTRYKRDSEVPENLGRRVLPHFVPKRKIRLPRGFIPATTVMSVAAMLVAWYGTQTELQASVTPAPDLTISETATVEPADPNILTVKALAPSWVQIKNKSGKVIISRVFVTGETWQTPRGSEVKLTVRDGGAIALLLGDEYLGAIGQRGIAIHEKELQFVGIEMSAEEKAVLAVTSETTPLTPENPATKNQE